MDGTPFGRYQLLELLGRGGMGEVWRAHDTATNRTVAIKVLPPQMAQDDTFVQRFRREAETAARLNNPHIIPIHTYGEIDGRLYVDMRLIEGRDLDKVLNEGPLEPKRAVRIIEQVATALHAAHKVGLVHRDVKPSNILLDEDDFAYLIDFGIARGADQTSLTSAGNVIGSWHYMAPERMEAHEADARADIYALTCVLYECLTGKPPFPGDTLESQVVGHLSTPPPRPSITEPEVPAAFDAVVTKGMAKDPEQRYPTTNDLARAAREASTVPVAAPFSVPAPPNVPAHSGPPAPPSAPPAPPAIPPAPPAIPPAPPAIPPPGAGFPPAPQPAYATPFPATPPPFPATPPPFPATTQGTSGSGPALFIVLAILVVGALIVAAIIGAVLLFGSGNKSSTATHGSSVSPSSGSITATSGTSASASSTSTTTSTSAAPSGPAQLETADGLSGLLTTIRDKFGDTMGYQLVVYPDYAVLWRASPTNKHVKQSYMYRGSWNNWAPDESISSFDVLVDLGQFNAAAVIAQVKNPPPDLNITDNSKNYLVVGTDPEGGGLEISMHSNAPGTGFMQINPDGSIKQLFPPS
jgi:serine/threonine protein kinase